MRRELPFGGALNHWDETVAYATVYGLVERLQPCRSGFKTIARSYTAPMRSPSPSPSNSYPAGKILAGRGSLPATIALRTFAHGTTQRRKVRGVGSASLVIRRNTNVKLVEPPSCSSASHIVFIGRNSRGDWVAQEQNGLYGGLFVNRAQAVKYALFENGRHPETIVELSREIELDMGGKLPSSDQSCADSRPARRMTHRGATQGEQTCFNLIPFQP